MKTFTETQRFRQWWIWTLLAACFIIVLGGLLLDGFQSFDLVPLLIPLSLVVGFYTIRLDTRIDQSGIRYRFLPVTGWRTIPWADIRHAVVKTSPFTTGRGGILRPGTTLLTGIGGCTSTGSRANG